MKFAYTSLFMVEIKIWQLETLLEMMNESPCVVQRLLSRNTCILPDDHDSGAASVNLEFYNFSDRITSGTYSPQLKVILRVISLSSDIAVKRLR